ncbi:6299_t:CDS:2, partial [Scutellospora calospora]
ENHPTEINNQEERYVAKTTATKCFQFLEILIDLVATTQQNFSNILPCSTDDSPSISSTGIALVFIISSNLLSKIENINIKSLTFVVNAPQ